MKIIDFLNEININEEVQKRINKNNREFIIDSSIKKVKYEKKRKALYLYIECVKIYKKEFIHNFEKELSTALNLNILKTEIIYKGCSVKENMDTIISEINQKFPSISDYLENAEIECDDAKLCIYTVNNAKQIFKLKNIKEEIKSLIYSMFHKNFTVEIIYNGKNEKQINKNISDRIINDARNKAITKKKKNSVKKKKNSKTNIIKGRAIKEEPRNINELTLEDNIVCVQGKVFHKELVNLRNGKQLVTYYLTYDNNSITCKTFFDSQKDGDITESIELGKYLKVKGRIQYDSYSKETVIMVNSIESIEVIKKMDTSENKRVELHLHTNMSAMDSVVNTSDVIKLASEWGHNAIAITDHGVLQAYPEAFKFGEKYNIKILYGLEAYVVEGAASIVSQMDQRNIDTEYTVVDIETTGLSKSNDRITEIGACKIRKGQVVETYQTFVNPKKPIPVKIQELTGITNSMVRDKRTIDEILPEFINFIDETCLVAHNAGFDFDFIKRDARRNNIEINNPILDTLALSRAMYPKSKSHKLKTMLRKFKIKNKNHHRAIDDAKATAYMFCKMLEILKLKHNLNLLKELNSLINEEDAYKHSAMKHLIILVKNKKGLKNLYNLVSLSHLKYFYRKPRIPKNILDKYREGLIFGSACEAGELYRAYIENKSEDEIEKIAKYYDFLEIQPIGNNEFMLRQGTVDSKKELMDINERIYKLGRKLNIPVVATGDVHFINKEDNKLREVIMTAQDFSDADKQPPLFFRTTDEMIDEFRYLGKEEAYEVVVENTNKISDMIEKVEPIPRGTFPPRMENSNEEIKEKTYGKAKEIYGNKLPNIVKERIEKELGSIIKHGFSVMYMIAQKLVQKSLKDGYLVGSRGSIGSSFVAYLIGITEVNSLPSHYICEECKYSEFVKNTDYECGFDLPEKECPVCGTRMQKDGYDIPFETFLGIDGDKEPDIDLNFSGDYQSVAHRYTEELFGKNHVFRAGTISTLGKQTAFGFVKKYMEVNEIELPKAEIERLSMNCMGVKRTTGQHPGGVMIVPRDMEIYDFSPVQHPADDSDSDIITTHFDYNFLHSSILKLDILGHDDPTMIKMLEKNTDVKAQSIKIGDPETMKIFTSLEPLGIKKEDIGTELGTLGIPEFGTGFVRNMLKDTKPKTFAELIKISGLSHGTDVWLGNAKELIDKKTCTLKDTICCRDDIMLYLTHKGVEKKNAFMIMEDVRKGKGLKDDFLKEMEEKNVPNWYIWSCGRIKYMFPKAHAAAYVMMAFRIAWFKVNRPLAYYCSFFSIRGDEFESKSMLHGKEVVMEKMSELNKLDKQTQKEKNLYTILELVNEYYARGFEFLPIDVYKSHASNFIIEDGKLRPPLRAISGLGSNAANKIMEERKKEEFLSVEDMAKRTKVSKTVVEIMEEENCFSNIAKSNQLLLF